jgi:hypothetical protein
MNYIFLFNEVRSVVPFKQHTRNRTNSTTIATRKTKEIYCNYKTENFATRLTKLVNDNFEQIDFKVALKVPNE